MMMILRAIPLFVGFHEEIRISCGAFLRGGSLCRGGAAEL
jgi:hypothetical protein